MPQSVVRQPYYSRVGRRANTACVKRLGVVIGETPKRVREALLPRFGHQIGESRQRHELAGGKERSEGLKAVVWCLEVARIVRKIPLGLPSRPCLFRGSDMPLRRGKVDAPPMAFRNYGHQP